MKIYGLIGYPLEHSFSKKYFNEKFEREHITGCSYRNFPLTAIDGFPLLVRNTPGLAGLNVTIPYKEQVVTYLNALDPVAEAVGAVNTIRFSEVDGDTWLTGFNTDVYGFSESVTPALDSSIDRALILGTGGASKAVNYVLENLGIEVLYVSRTKTKGPVISYQSLTEEIISSCRLIVNTTPLGTHPAVDEYPPIPYQAITHRHILYDLVYNPPLTAFLIRGKEQGATILNGSEMLRLQAEKSWEIWNG